jgi:hypothetical protein
MDSYAPYCDVIMPWTEPAPPGDLRPVDLMIGRAIEIAAGAKPVWPIIQMVGAAYAQDSSLDPQGNGRSPTPEEFRCMVYLALARGAGGVFCYALTSPRSRTQRAYDIRQDAPQLWEMVQKVAVQVRALSPALLDGEPLEVKPDGLREGVAVRGLRHKEYGYVIIANANAESVPLRFSVPGFKGQELGLGFDEGSLTATAEGLFADTLGPHAVRTYVAKWE